MPPGAVDDDPEAEGERFRECDGCPELVVVRAGTYMMGSPSGEARRESDEGPVHEVRIGEPFAVGVYEVTFAEWDVCRGEGGCSHNPGDWGWGRGTRPVVDVSWEDAQEYVRWLSGKTGQRYRLLSESEWDRVVMANARAGFCDRSTQHPAQRSHVVIAPEVSPLSSASRCGLTCTTGR